MVDLKLTKKNFLNATKNTLVLGVNSQPAASEYYSKERWDELETYLLYITKNEVPFSIIGDMNGCIEEEPEFLLSDNHILNDLV